MKRVLIDINVVLDMLLERKLHLAASAAVWDAIESGGVPAAPSTLTAWVSTAVQDDAAHPAIRSQGCCT